MLWHYNTVLLPEALFAAERKVTRGGNKMYNIEKQ